MFSLRRPADLRPVLSGLPARASSFCRRAGRGFSAADMQYVENGQATLAGVLAALAQFLPRAGPDDLALAFVPTR